MPLHGFPDQLHFGVQVIDHGEKHGFSSLRNHGSTIPEAEIPLLFERFHKSDRSRSQDRDGVGLGLYIVKTILNNHGEDIAVTSRQGVTDFVFTLALKPESKKGDAKKQ